MRALSPSQQEILSLMGVEIWRQRDNRLPRADETADAPTWIIAAQPDFPAEVIVVCECESPDGRLDPSTQRLLDNILCAIGSGHARCLQLLCVGSGDEDSVELNRILQESSIGEKAPLLMFGSRIGGLVGKSAIQASGTNASAVLPALSTMLTEPQSKRKCWRRLQEMLAREN